VLTSHSILCGRGVDVFWNDPINFAASKVNKKPLNNFENITNMHSGP
jgi:hypothetical protein